MDSFLDRFNSRWAEEIRDSSYPDLDGFVRYNGWAIIEDDPWDTSHRWYVLNRMVIGDGLHNFLEIIYQSPATEMQEVDSTELVAQVNVVEPKEVTVTKYVRV